jgi:mRNA interferase MazF
MAINRFEVYLVNLDPTVGSEIQKTRLCQKWVAPSAHTGQNLVVAMATVATRALMAP